MIRFEDIDKDTVNQILFLYKNTSHTCNSLAKKFSIPVTLVSQILKKTLGENYYKKLNARKYFSRRDNLV